MAESSLCCAPGCLDDALELAPIPLCRTHLRETYEFAAAMVNERWSLALAEAQVNHEPVAVHEVVGEPVRSAGFVYFIRFSDRIKIGWSANPQQRIADLPHDEVMAIISGSLDDERGYHKRFARLRVRGEWFRLDQELIDFISGL